MDNLNSQQNYASEWDDRRKEEFTMLLLNRSANDTSKFVCKVQDIAENYGYMKDQILRLKIAAWYYDIGFEVNSTGDDIEFTIESKYYFQRMNIDHEKLNIISSTMRGRYVEELNYSEKILHDAELANLVDKNNFNRTISNRNLFNRKYGLGLSNKEWLQIFYSMISNRVFYTDYARRVYSNSKKDMQNELLKMIHSRKIDSRIN